MNKTFLKKMWADFDKTCLYFENKYEFPSWAKQKQLIEIACFQNGMKLINHSLISENSEPNMNKFIKFWKDFSKNYNNHTIGCMWNDQKRWISKNLFNKKYNFKFN